MRLTRILRGPQTPLGGRGDSLQSAVASVPWVPSLFGFEGLLYPKPSAWVEPLRQAVQGLFMFLTLLLVTFAVSVLVSLAVARMFANPIKSILNRVIADTISAAWVRYMKFAILVVGVSAGVRIYELEKYISPARNGQDSKVLELTQERWILELYRTVIEALQGIAWLLLVFFVFALIAYVIVRIAEMKSGSSPGQGKDAAA